MANQLKMAVANAIITLKQRGWSNRRIARELGIDRATVKRHLELARNGSKPATNAPPGQKSQNQPLWYEFIDRRVSKAKPCKRR